MTTKKVVTTVIKATSRASIKIGDSFYTLEYGEERSVDPTLTAKGLKQAKTNLWADVNAEVDQQVEDIIELYKK